MRSPSRFHQGCCLLFGYNNIYMYYLNSLLKECLLHSTFALLCIEHKSWFEHVRQQVSPKCGASLVKPWQGKQGSRLMTLEAFHRSHPGLDRTRIISKSPKKQWEYC
jgi:hypothetical protein